MGHALSTSSAAEIEADAVVVGIASGPDGLVLVPGAQALDAALGGGLLAALTGLGATGKTLVLDLAVDPTLDLSTRNITGLSYIAANRVSARSVMDATTVIATKAALERLQEALR